MYIVCSRPKWPDYFGEKYVFLRKDILKVFERKMIIICPLPTFPLILHKFHVILKLHKYHRSIRHLLNWKTARQEWIKIGLGLRQGMYRYTCMSIEHIKKGAPIECHFSRSDSARKMSILILDTL